ncbi:hypothetical protein [Halomonas sp. S3-1-8]|uniref:hypothetical protein n=1 Tax=Halomonas sp. S3-1-8 TaxID=2986806 RepID=UPI003FA5BEB2
MSTPLFDYLIVALGMTGQPAPFGARDPLLVILECGAIHEGFMNVIAVRVGDILGDVESDTPRFFPSQTSVIDELVLDRRKITLGDQNVAFQNQPWYVVSFIAFRVPS